MHVYFGTIRDNGGQRTNRLARVFKEGFDVIFGGRFLNLY